MDTDDFSEMAWKMIEKAAQVSDTLKAELGAMSMEHAAEDDWLRQPDLLKLQRTPLDAKNPQSLSNCGLDGYLQMVLDNDMAEKQGFEPWVELPPQRFSRPSRSTTPALLRVGPIDTAFLQGRQLFERAVDFARTHR